MTEARRLLLGGLASIILLELALQTGAAVMWLSTPEPEEPDHSAEHLVLCVGDSYTFGIGTTSQELTYPHQLERELRRNGQDWRVFASALPGRNSREVLERIDSQLEHFRPDVVCVLVGLNDRWSQPELLDLRATPGAAVALHDAVEFRWRWRTARMVQWAIGKFVSDAESRDRSAEAESTVTRELREGAPERALAHVESLRAELGQIPRVEVAEALVVALATLGEGERCLREARDALERWPESGELWHHYAWQSYQDDDLETATEAIDEAHRLTIDEPLPKRWSILWHRAVIWMRRDPARSLATAVELYLAEEKAATFRGLVTYEPGAFSGEVLEEVLGQLSLPEDKAARIRKLFTGALSWQSTDMASIYKSHLRQVVERCKERGTAVVLLTYPRELGYVEQVTEELAQALGVSRVVLAPEFGGRLAENPEREYFVPDGHCNDLGYGVMAEVVAGVILGM